MATSPHPALEVASWSAEATRELAARLSEVALPGDVVCLWGDLGAGKTVFAKGFGRGLGIEDTISSPTFVLMAEYAGRLPLFHIDLYRLASATEALDGGLVDDRQSTGVVLIEWPDRLGSALPPDRLDVSIDGEDEPRRIGLEARGSGYGRYVEAAARARGRLPGPPSRGDAA
jgi:tRNA threonylcarbamoyladenosine biosynthesis protein TsaE